MPGNGRGSMPGNGRGVGGDLRTLRENSRKPEALRNDRIALAEQTIRNQQSSIGNHLPSRPILLKLCHPRRQTSCQHHSMAPLLHPRMAEAPRNLGEEIPWACLAVGGLGHGNGCCFGPPRPCEGIRHVPCRDPSLALAALSIPDSTTLLFYLPRKGWQSWRFPNRLQAPRRTKSGTGGGSGRNHGRTRRKKAPSCDEPGFLAAQVFAVALETGGAEERILFMPLARLAQYQHCLLRRNGVRTT